MIKKIFQIINSIGTAVLELFCNQDFESFKQDFSILECRYNTLISVYKSHVFVHLKMTILMDSKNF